MELSIVGVLPDVTGSVTEVRLTLALEQAAAGSGGPSVLEGSLGLCSYFLQARREIWTFGGHVAAFLDDAQAVLKGQSQLARLRDATEPGLEIMCVARRSLHHPHYLVSGHWHLPMLPGAPLGSEGGAVHANDAETSQFMCRITGVVIEAEMLTRLTDSLQDLLDSTAVPLEAPW